MTNIPGLTATVRYGAPLNDSFPDAEGWTVTLRYKGRQLTTPYYMGPALCREPEPVEVLECLLTDLSAGEQSFATFCATFGYDTDSRRAYHTWQACCRTATRVRRLLGDDLDAITAKVYA